MLGYGYVYRDEFFLCSFIFHSIFFFDFPSAVARCVPVSLFVHHQCTDSLQYAMAPFQWQRIRSKKRRGKLHLPLVLYMHSTHIYFMRFTRCSLMTLPECSPYMKRTDPLPLHSMRPIECATLFSIHMSCVMCSVHIGRPFSPGRLLKI